MSLVKEGQFLILREYDYPIEGLRIYHTLTESFGEAAPAWPLYTELEALNRDIPMDIPGTQYFHTAQVIKGLRSRERLLDNDSSEYNFGDHVRNRQKAREIIKSQALAKLSFAEKQALELI